MEVTLAKSREAFLEIRKLPAPRRGEILRQIRDELSKKVSILIVHSCSQIHICSQNRDQVVFEQNHILWNDPHHCFVYSLNFEDDHMCIWLFTQCGILVMEPILWLHLDVGISYISFNH